MSDRMELSIGAQTQAAKAIAEDLTGVVKPLQDLGTALESHIPGFSGSAAAGFGEVLQAWFQKATDLPKGLASYAEKLATADKNAYESEVQTVSTMQNTALATHISNRLG